MLAARRRVTQILLGPHTYTHTTTDAVCGLGGTDVKNGTVTITHAQPQPTSDTTRLCGSQIDAHGRRIVVRVSRSSVRVGSPKSSLSSRCSISVVCLVWLCRHAFRDRLSAVGLDAVQVCHPNRAKARAASTRQRVGGHLRERSRGMCAECR